MITTLITSIQTYSCGFYDIRKTTTSIVLVNKTAYRTGTDGVTEFIQLWFIRVGINPHTANLLPTLASAITFFTSPHVSCLLTFTEGGISQYGVRSHRRRTYRSCSWFRGFGLWVIVGVLVVFTTLVSPTLTLTLITTLTVILP